MSEWWRDQDEDDQWQRQLWEEERRWTEEKQEAAEKAFFELMKLRWKDGR